MPLYEYQCAPHNHRFEVRHGINEEPVRACPECGGEVRRVIHPVGIVFKGAGFYATDSRGDKQGAKAAGTSTEGSNQPEKKPESKSETPAAS